MAENPAHEPSPHPDPYRCCGIIHRERGEQRQVHGSGIRIKIKINRLLKIARFLIFPSLECFECQMELLFRRWTCCGVVDAALVII